MVEERLGLRKRPSVAEDGWEFLARHERISITDSSLPRSCRRQLRRPQSGTSAKSAPYCRGMREEDVADRLVSALSHLDAVVDEVTSEEALQEIDEATLEVFWRDWPEVNAWGHSLWQRLNEDLAGPATPPQDPDLDEVGESG